MKTQRLILLVLAYALIAFGLMACGSDDDEYTYSNIDMDAHFLLIPSSSSESIVYFAGKDNGNLLDHSFMNKEIRFYDNNGNAVTGAYVINSDGSFTLEIWQVGTTLSFNGQLSDMGDRGTLRDATTGANVGDLIKVLDYTNLVGTWTGTLTETGTAITHDLAVNVLDGQFGSVQTGGISTVGGYLVTRGIALTAGGYATIFLETNSADPYSEYRIWGNYSSGNITNVHFDVDSDTISGTGTLSR